MQSEKPPWGHTWDAAAAQSPTQGKSRAVLLASQGTHTVPSLGLEGLQHLEPKSGSVRKTRELGSSRL